MSGVKPDGDVRGVLYYFTGTGNSLAVARRLTERFPALHLRSIAAFTGEKTTEVPGDVIGFVFPAYYGGLPNLVRRFIKSLDFRGARYIFCIVTPAYPWSCFALHQMKNLLGAKNRKLSAGFYVAMPENYIMKYEIPSVEKQAAIFRDAERSIVRIGNAIERRMKHRVIETAFYAFVPYPYFMARLPRSDRYYRVDERCHGCGICAAVCPVGNIRLEEGRPRWQGRCEVCLACVSYCPAESIQWKTVTERRKRFHHPDVTAKDLINQRKNLEK